MQKYENSVKDVLRKEEKKKADYALADVEAGKSGTSDIKEKTVTQIRGTCYEPKRTQGNRLLGKERKCK
jgi:hypothetical protein